MPKELKELSGFMRGTMSAPSESDIPDETATYSLNLDPITEVGKLKGIADDLRIKEGGQGIRKVVASYSVLPDASEDQDPVVAGTSVLLVAGDQIQLKLTSGIHSATTDNITFSTDNNTTWIMIMSKLTSQIAQWDNEVVLASNGSHSANLLTEGQEFTSIQSPFANILSSVGVRGAHVTFNTDADPNLDPITITGGEHGIATDGATQEIIGLTLEGPIDSDELTVEIIKTQATYMQVLSEDAQGDPLTPFLNVAANEMQFLKDGTKDNLFFYDKSDSNKVKIVEDFYSTRNIIDGPTEETTTEDEVDQELGSFNLPESNDISMENYNNAMYIGPGKDNKSKWMGYVDNVQMGESNKGFFLTDAELLPLDGTDGSASIDRMIDLGSTGSTDAKTNTGYESTYVNDLFWIGVNRSTYHLYSIQKNDTGTLDKPGKIVGSDDTLPIKPTIITPCKHTTTGTVADNNIWIANGRSNDVYRVEGIVINPDDGKVTWSGIYKFAGSFDTASSPVDHAIMIDLLETYDSTGTATSSKNYLWALYGPGGNDKFGVGEPFIYSARMGSDAGLISYAAGGDDTFTWHDRTPASQTLEQRNGTQFYDDTYKIDWGNDSSYISNMGWNQRRVFRYYWHSPTTANENAWLRSDGGWTTPEHGYDIVQNINDTALEEDMIKPYHQSYTACDELRGPNDDNLKPSYYGGWESGYECSPYRLIDLSANNFNTAYSGTTYRSHTIGAFTMVKGTLFKKQGELGYQHLSFGYWCASHHYKFYNSVGVETESFNGLCILTTSTNHFGVKHFYRSHDGTGGTGTVGTFRGGTSGSPVDIGVRNSCFNTPNKVTITKQVEDDTATSGGAELVSVIQDQANIFDILKIPGANMALMSYRGDDYKKTYISVLDLSNADGTAATSSLGYKDKSNYPYVISADEANRSLQGSVLGHREIGAEQDAILVSPTAGMYENGEWKIDSSTGVKEGDYDLNTDSPEDFGISVVLGEANADGPFATTVTYHYKASILYDDFQESPLTSAADKLTPTLASLNMLITVNTMRPLSPRATHIIVYRKNGEDEFYKMVKELRLADSWQDKGSGLGFSKTFVDDGSVGATYEAITGMPETLRETSVNYQLSTQADGALFIANCDHPKVENGDHFIFRSQTGNLSVFNWAQDYLIMPQIPTAIKSYAGKLYVWDLANMYRVSTMNLQIEDTYEGMGCSSENSVIVTDRGMFFCDETNMYMHNGSAVQPIGDSILQSSGGTSAYAWQDIIHATPPLVTYNATTGSVYFMFNHNDTVFRAWVYNVRSSRWDQIECPKPLSTILGPKNEVLVSDGTNLWQVNASADKKLWSYHSKDLSMGLHTQKKSLKKIKIEADDISNLDGLVTVEINDSSETFSSDYSGSKDTAFLMLPSNKAAKTFKRMKIKIDDADTEVDSIGVIFSKKGVK